MTVLTAQGLGGEAFGAFVIIIQVVVFAQIAVVFTLDTALLRYVPEFRQVGDARGLRRLAMRVGGLQTALFGLVGGALWASWDRLNAFYDVELTGVWVTALVLLGAMAARDTMAAMLTAFYETRVRAVASTVGGLAGLAALGWLVWGADAGVDGALGAFAVRALVSTLIMAWAFGRLWREFCREGPSNTTVNREVSVPMSRLLRFSGLYFLDWLLGMIVWRQSETLVLGRYAAKTTVGAYSLGYELPQRLVEFFPNVFASVANVFATDRFLVNPETLGRSLRRYTEILYFIVAPLALAGAAVAIPVVALFLEPAMSAAGPLAATFFVVQSLMYLLAPYRFAVRIEEKLWVSVKLNLIVAAVNIGWDFLLIPVYGVAGAVAAVVLAQLFTIGLRVWAYRRLFPYIEVPWAYIARCYLAAMPWLGWLGVWWASNGSPLGMVLAAAPLGVLWVLSVRRLGLVTPELTLLVQRSPYGDEWPVRWALQLLGTDRQ